MTWYFDSSAIMKLIVNEKESMSLRDFVLGSRATSRISQLEVVRNVHRLDSKSVKSAREKLNAFEYVEINESVLRNAEEVAMQLELKSLDALQVGSALFIKDFIEGVICYDKNINAALMKLGVKVLQPGVKA